MFISNEATVILHITVSVPDTPKSESDFYVDRQLFRVKTVELLREATALSEIHQFRSAQRLIQS